MIYTTPNVVALEYIYNNFFAEFGCVPQIEHTVGDVLLNRFDRKDDALIHFKNSALYCERDTLKKIYSDIDLCTAVGCSQTDLLKYYEFTEDLDSTDEQFIRNLIGSSYILLSRSINLTGKYSVCLHHRADLISDWIKIFIDKVIPLDISFGLNPYVFLVGDYFGAYKYYLDSGEVPQIDYCLSETQKWYDWIGDLTIQGKEGFDYSYDQLFEISEKRHTKILKNLEPDFLNGDFLYNNDIINKIN